MRKPEARYRGSHAASVVVSPTMSRNVHHAVSGLAGRSRTTECSACSVITPMTQSLQDQAVTRTPPRWSVGRELKTRRLVATQHGVDAGQSRRDSAGAAAGRNQQQGRQQRHRALWRRDHPPRLQALSAHRMTIVVTWAAPVNRRASRTVSTGKPNTPAGSLPGAAASPPLSRHDRAHQHDVGDASIRVRRHASTATWRSASTQHTTRGRSNQVARISATSRAPGGKNWSPSTRPDYSNIGSTPGEPFKRVRGDCGGRRSMT